MVLELLAEKDIQVCQCVAKCTQFSNSHVLLSSHDLQLGNACWKTRGTIKATTILAPPILAKKCRPDAMSALCMGPKRFNCTKLCHQKRDVVLKESYCLCCVT